MKKIRLIISTMALAATMSISVFGETGAVNTLCIQNVTKETLANIQLPDVTPVLTESVFNTNTEEILQDNSENEDSSIIIESNKLVKTTKKKKKKKKQKEYKSIGTFKVTGYCKCSRCCGKSTGITASGTTAKAGRTIAADTSRFAFGSKMVINGHTYTVEDRGGAINGNRIDIFFSSHSEALQWGVRYCTVYVKNK